MARPSDDFAATMSDPLACPILVDRYSTAGVPGYQRYEMWANHDHQASSPLFETVPQGIFQLESMRFALGDIFIMQAEVTGQSYLRSSQMLRKDGYDSLVVSVRIRGIARGDANDRSFVAEDGSIGLIDMARPSFHVSDPSNTIMALIPRRVAEARIGPMSLLHGMVIPPARAALLRSHLIQIHQHIGETPAGHSRVLGETVIDLLGLAVAASGVTIGPAAHETAAMLQARQFIAAHLGSPTLGTAALCRALGISRSTLYRLFEAEGGVQAYIRNGRLEAVHAALCDPKNRARIADLADQWGFCDAAYLSRSYREAFGMTPSEARALNDAGAASRLLRAGS